MDKRTRLLAKVLDLCLRQICTQQFNGGRAVKIHLLTEIHIREAPTSQKFFEAVVAYLLTHPVPHCQSPYTQKSGVKIPHFIIHFVELRGWCPYSLIYDCGETEG